MFGAVCSKIWASPRRQAKDLQPAGLRADDLHDRITEHLLFALGHSTPSATPNDRYQSLRQIRNLS